jgi:hypothetical protein
MDIGEFVLLVLTAVMAGSWLLRVGRRLVSVDSLACESGPRVAYALTLLGCLIAVVVALQTLAPDNVRTSGNVRLLFIAATVAAIAITTLGFALLGIDALGDGIESNNPAARLSVLCLWPAVTICAIGANIGEGSFVGTTLMPLALTVIFLLMLAGIFSATTTAFTTIASDRDLGAAMRLAGVTLAWSLLLAHAAQGDWVSLRATLRDFIVAISESFGVLLFAIVVERRSSSSSREGSFVSRAVVPAIGYVALAIIVIALHP